MNYKNSISGMAGILAIAFILLPFVSRAQKAPAALKLPSLISDNMLLQQKTNVKIWGKAAPGKPISVNASWKAKGQATADQTGRWQLVLPSPVAGGPYTITVTGSDTAITIKNVLIGEVWFCSGQSNMEMPLAGWPPNDTIEHSKSTIASANNSEIRLFNVQRAFSLNPTDECTGKWEVCTSNSVQSFSATAYFFGKKLYDHLRVPVGLIESAWGGTPIESWTSGASLESAGEFKKELTEMSENVPKYKAYMEWLHSREQAEVKPLSDSDKWQNLTFNDERCALPLFDDSAWPLMKLPRIWEQTELGDFDGVVWFRKKFELPAQMVGKDLVLSLGPIDDMDRVYFNGKLVGSVEIPGFWKNDRMYDVPSSIVKDVNTIAVRVLDTQGGGGIYGKPDQMKLFVKNSTESQSLDGNWKYSPVAEYSNNTFYLFNVQNQEFFTKPRPKSLNAYKPTALYNAMVNPVLPYKIKGAIWYQGEANVGRAEQYAKLLPLMIQDWRKSWNIENFPFYYVQIAPWEYSGPDAAESAELREAQSKAMNFINTGMVVTLDIGVVKNIHPPFKLEVGERLAKWALAKNYDVKVPFTGPVYKSMTRNGNSIKLQFDYIEGGLVAKNNELKEFEIAGKDGKYVPAKAQIINNEIVVSSQAVEEPVKVRYCWRNGAEASLFNKAGLPASSFRTE